MHHLPSVDVWLKEELSAIRHPITKYLIASVTLVNFPQFPEIHRLIPRVLDLTLMYTTGLSYHQIEENGKYISQISSNCFPISE